MSLETRLVTFVQAVGGDVKTLNLLLGTLSTLNTTAKNNLVAAINELKAAIDAAGNESLINDAAGDGVTDKTWSANKIHDSIETAKAEVKDELVNGSGAALDTLAELAAALGNDPNFATTMATQIANRVRFDEAQSLSTTQQGRARDNIGAIAANAVGNPERDLVAVYTAAKA